MEIKVKLERKYEAQTKSLILHSYEEDLKRLVRFVYPSDWDVNKLDLYINMKSKFHVREIMFSADINMMKMKDNLEKIKELGYKVVAVNQMYGYIVREDGKFISYSMAGYSSNGGICFTYRYKPSRLEGTGAVQGDYDFGYCQFSKNMIDKMMDRPKLYGVVERYKDFVDFCRYEVRFNSSLRKYIKSPLTKS